MLSVDASNGVSTMDLSFGIGGWRFDPPALNRPRWLVASGYGLIMTVLVCWPVWPGLMSFDSLYAYRQSVNGVETAVWPPMHDYLMFLSRITGTGPGALFATQTFLLFGGIAVLMNLFIGSLLRHLIAIAIFGASFWIFPVQLGTASTVWKDVPVVTFSIVAIACWLEGVRIRSPAFFAAAMFSVFLAISTRWNTLPLLGPTGLFVIIFPWSWTAGIRDRLIAAGSVVLVLVATVATSQWRLPDLQRLPPVENALSGIQLYDMVGVSICENKNLVPAILNNGAPLTPDIMRSVYDARHFNLTMVKMGELTGPPKPGLNTSEIVSRAWFDAVLHHTACYLTHRFAIAREQFGLTRDSRVFYPIHAGIDENEFGLKLANPQAAGERVQYVYNQASEWPNRPIWMYLLLIVTTVAVLVFRVPSRFLIVSLVLGSLAFLALLFVASPAADARYLFPTNIVCVLASVLGAAGLIARVLPEKSLQAVDEGGAAAPEPAEQQREEPQPAEQAAAPIS